MKELIAQMLETDENDVLTAREAADILGIQHRSVLKATERDRLEGTKIGSMWYYRRDDVELYGESRNHGSESNNCDSDCIDTDTSVYD